MMRPQLIREISALYPPDFNEEGRELLMDAMCNAWRELPMPVLECLLIRCTERDQRGIGG